MVHFPLFHVEFFEHQFPNEPEARQKWMILVLKIGIRFRNFVREEAIVARDLRTEIFEQILSFVIRTIITEQPGIKYDNKILSWLKIKINLG